MSCVGCFEARAVRLPRRRGFVMACAIGAGRQPARRAGFAARIPVRSHSSEDSS
ncbi:hypothetical protein C7S16_5815 [Burkholderia thailandensis]|uniref:Uncharacterized protein n=1 Tax=Burkholderia thailandensis TaxID=57975 RepID=A0AAW9CKF2_BURTH|nr:hypothetical protein [Burkholderia thailandensis]